MSMQSPAEIRRAINLRHRTQDAAAVLAAAQAAMERMTRSGRMAPGEGRRMARLIGEARRRDRTAGGKE